MPKTPTKVLREKISSSKIKGHQPRRREKEREGTRRSLEDGVGGQRSEREKQQSEDPIRSNPIRSDQRERERQFFVFYSLCVIFDIIIIVWCNHHHSPSRKTRGKKGKKERKKERKKKSRDDEDDEDDEEEEYGVGGIRTIQQE